MVSEEILDNIDVLYDYLTDADKIRLAELMANHPTYWAPFPGRQSMAFHSKADVIGLFGGAGSGKSQVGIGKALTKHKRTKFYRLEVNRLEDMQKKMSKLVGTKDGYDKQLHYWTLKGWDYTREITFAGLLTPQDVQNNIGYDCDFIVFDEGQQQKEEVVRYLHGWLRTDDPNQPCQLMITMNPPQHKDQLWVVDFFAPWLNPNHPNPAKEGELRYFTGKKTEAGDVVEVEIPKEELNEHGRIFIDGRWVRPLSRTCIMSTVEDNPIYTATGYSDVLAAQIGVNRDKLLLGLIDFNSMDDRQQVIPTEWVNLAMDRWSKLDIKPRMDAIGVDVARGGLDRTTMARRHGYWFDEILTWPGKETKDGIIVVNLLMKARNGESPGLYIDAGTVGSGVLDSLTKDKVKHFPILAQSGTKRRDKTGHHQFSRMRSWYWWNLRDLLDPANGYNTALPPDEELKEELCAARWKHVGKFTQVDLTETIRDRIGRSPDKATAVCLAGIHDYVAPDNIRYVKEPYHPMRVNMRWKDLWNS